MSKVPLSFSTTSSSPSKQQTIPAIPLICLILLNRYAEIVNVKLGDGSMRKGQVLEIAGKRAVVQVSLLSVKVISYNLVLVFAINHFAFILNHLSNPICIVDFRGNIWHWQLAHSLRVHWWCVENAHQYWDVGKIIQRFRYSHRSRSPCTCREVPRHPGKIKEKKIILIIECSLLNVSLLQ